MVPHRYVEHIAAADAIAVFRFLCAQAGIGLGKTLRLAHALHQAQSDGINIYPAVERGIFSGVVFVVNDGFVAGGQARAGNHCAAGGKGKQR